MSEARESLVLPWVVMTLTLVLLGALGWTARDNARLQLTQKSSAPSEISLAYLQARIQSTRPDDPVLAELLQRLAHDNITLGHSTRAETAIAHLEQLDRGAYRNEGLLLQLELARQLRFQAAPGSPERALATARLGYWLAQAPSRNWSLPQLLTLWESAHSVGSLEALQWLSIRLTKLDPSQGEFWYRDLGRFALSLQEYGSAAAANFTALRLAPDPARKLLSFQAGIQALVAGDRAPEACNAARANLGLVVPDSFTLALVLRVAMLGQCRDLALQMARRLLLMATAGQSVDSLLHRAGILPVRGTTTAALPPARASKLVFHFHDSDRPRWFRVAAQGADPGLPAATYELMYEAFVQNHQLTSAQTVARKALEHTAAPALWQQRLAQLAEWNAQPALALKYWLELAHQHDDPLAWERISELSRQMNQIQVYLEALLHQAQLHPHDGVLIDRLVATYERMAQPDKSLALLKASAVGSLRVTMLEHYAQIALGNGADELAYSAFSTLQQEFGPRAEYAIALARINQRRHHLPQALADLTSVAAQVDSDPLYAPFWRILAELALLLGDDQRADLAYRNLLSSGLFALPPPGAPLPHRDRDQLDQLQSDLESMEEFYANYPYDAARLQELDFRLTGSLNALQSALENFSASGNWSRVGQLLAGLSPPQRQSLVLHSDLLIMRARFKQHSGQFRAAAADLRQALALPRLRESERINLLWALIDLEQSRELKLTLQHWAGLLRTYPAYWSVAGAAYLQLGQPRPALHFLQLQPEAEHRNPSWLLLVAEAEELSGQDELAWRLRRRAWRQFALARSNLPQQPTRRSTLRVSNLPTRFADSGQESLEDPESALVQRAHLGALFLTGDRNLGELRRLLRRVLHPPLHKTANLSLLDPLPAIQQIPGTNQTDCAGSSESGAASSSSQPLRCQDPSAVLNIFLDWAITHDENDLALRLGSLARGAPDPAQARLSSALLQADRATLSTLLDDPENHQPPLKRLEALSLLERPQQLQSAAFESATELPDNSASTAALRSALTAPLSLLGERTGPVTNAYWSPLDNGAPVLIAQSSLTRWSPLSYREQALGLGQMLDSRLGFALEGVERQTESTDSTHLARVPALDRNVLLTMRDHLPEREILFTVGQRETDYRTASYLGSVQWQLEPTLRTRMALGWHQFTNMTPALQIAGMKDLFEADAEWDLSPRWYAQGTFESDRFAGQNGTSLGHGNLESGELGYHLALEPSELTVRLITFQGQSHSTTQPLGTLVSYVPAQVPAQANFFLPGSISQSGLLLSWNTAARSQPARASWEPYLDTGLIQDRSAGTMPQLDLGLSGALIGGDAARIYYFHVTTPGSSVSLSQIGLSYRYFY